MKLDKETLKKLDDYFLNTPEIMVLDFEDRVDKMSKELSIDTVLVEEYLLIVLSNDGERIYKMYEA